VRLLYQKYHARRKCIFLFFPSLLNLNKLAGAAIC
jgi:hypothetical protein